MRKKEKIYVSVPLNNPRIEVRNLNLERLTRVVTRLANAGYFPAHPPVFYPGLSEDMYDDLSKIQISASSRVFAIPYNNGLIPEEVSKDIAYASREGVPVVRFQSESEFSRWLRAKILTFTGPSGVGKTTVVRGLLEDKSNDLKIVTSVTTREPRDSDLPGEYMYITDQEFTAMEGRGEFLWTAGVHGNKYGTTKSSIQEALVAPGRSLMLLVPEVLDTLYEYTDGKVWSFYILSPPEDILRERLVKRGEKPEDIIRRISDCKRWDAEARAKGSFYTFVRNEQSVEEAIKKILKHI